MDKAQVHKGMVVDSDQGIGTILVVDHQQQMVLLAQHESGKQCAVSFHDIEQHSMSWLPPHER